MRNILEGKASAPDHGGSGGSGRGEGGSGYVLYLN